MVKVVLARERLRVENGGMKLLIRGEGRVGMLQILLRDPRIFFGQVFLPSDQEEMGRRSSVVAYNLFYFVFFFPVNKVRRWHWEVLSMDLVFTIGW